MALAQWYELRLEGSAGTRAGIPKGATEGIAIGDNGRLCSIATGHAMRFESEQHAMDYLGKSTIPGNYRLEIVPCGNSPAGKREQIRSTIPHA